MATAAPTEDEIDKVRMQRIKQQEAHVRELEVAYKTKQEESKSAREELSDAIFQLRRLIRGEVEEQPELDFGDDGEPSDESWDALLSATKLIDAITLTKPQRKKFEDLGVITVKHFEQLRAAELPGISGSLAQHFSEATADKLEDDVLDWMDRKRIERGTNRSKQIAEMDQADRYEQLHEFEEKQKATAKASRTVGGRPVKARK